MVDGTSGVWNCEETLRRLYDYLDGELTDERRAAIRLHLDNCSHCFEAFDFEADLRRLIATKCRDVVPDGLRERVASALRAEQHGAAPPGAATAP